MVSERRGPGQAVVPLLAALTGFDFSDGEHRLLLHGSLKAALLRS